MLPESSQVGKIWDFLFQADDREASRVRKAGCGHCGGVLHSAHYGRKPRGIPSALAAAGECTAFRQASAARRAVVGRRRLLCAFSAVGSMSV